MTTQTETQIILKSKLNGRMIHQFHDVDTAKEWAQRWRERHGNRAPDAVIARVKIVKEEEVIEDV